MKSFYFATIAFIVCCFGQIHDYYVSSKYGNDKTGNGTKSNPFETIQTAQNVVKSLIQTLSKNSFNENISINIDNSGYYIGINPISIEDSLIGFSNKNFIIYQATNSNEPPSIHGDCLIIPSNKWNIINKINGLTLFQTNLKSEQNNLPPNGFIFEIFMNEIRMNISKSPLYKYIYLNSTSKIIETDNKNITIIDKLLSTNFSNDLLTLVYEDWTSSYHFINNIQYNSLTGKINITLKTSPVTWVNDPGSGSRFYLINNPQLLTTPNTFYYNRTSFDLFILLNQSNISNNDYIRIPKNVELLSIKSNWTTKKVERILFRNLHFAYTAPDFSTCFNSSCMGPGQSAADLPTATIHTVNVDSILFDNVNISHTGGYALWFDSGSINCYYKNSKITDLGAGGIRIDGDIVVVNISIHNNYLLNGGHIFEAGAGILAGQYAFSNITNNEIAYFRQSGISSGCSAHYGPTPVQNINIARNHIHDLGEWILSDMGCIYTSGEMRNSFYENNICHDVYSFDYGGWGLYADQATRYAVFRNNIVYNTKTAGNHQHFGLDNIYVNNIYAFNSLFYHNADGSIRSSQHAGMCNQTNPKGQCSSFTFITNIVYTNTTWGYPILWDEFHVGWGNMTVDGNLYWSIQQKNNLTFPDNCTIQQWVKQGKDVQHALDDPLFVDAENYNFALKPGSPAIGLGFHPIDTTNIGPDW
eukprot:138374_1